MKFLDGQLVTFLGDSITQHLVAVSDSMETQTYGLPPVDASIIVDRVLVTEGKVYLPGDGCTHCRLAINVLMMCFQHEGC